MIHIVLPGLTAPRWLCGGLLIARKLADLLNQHIDTDVVTSVDREDGVPFLDDVLERASREDIFVITWGPHVTGLLETLHGRRVVYYAQSTGWGSRLPVTVPVICLSRYIMAAWMREAPGNALFLLGPVVPPECTDRGEPRDIDVLFLERKSTPYLKDQLVPALSERLEVHTVRDFIPYAELIDLYNRSRVYLYSSAPWASGWVEGFGLQPLEAMLCGCTVFSNLHGGLSDFLDPEINAFKLEVHSLTYDLARIERAARGSFRAASSDLLALRGTYSEEAFHKRAALILAALDEFFSHAADHQADVLPVESSRAARSNPLERARAVWRRASRVRARSQP